MVEKGNETKVFVGARVLSNEAIKNTMPTYDRIKDKIEDIRRMAETSGNKESNKHNNTISIFGKRGTGKTSIMYSLREELRKEGSLNIMLDMLEPDNIGTEGRIIGCILGLFKSEIEKLDKKIKKNQDNIESCKLKNDYFENCRFKNNNPLRAKYDKLVEYYCYTEHDYRKLLISSYTDMNTYIKKSEYILSADIAFVEAFNQFIDEFIKVHKEINSQVNSGGNSESKEPLIFIFIDDADLNIIKCQEIVESLLKYTTHKNIVCIVSGDYKTFSEQFIVSLLKKEELSTSNIQLDSKILDDKTLLDRKQILGHEYMKKVFPPAYRNHVNVWDLKVRSRYKFGNDKNSKSLKELFEKLIEYRNVENIFGYKNRKRGEIDFEYYAHMLDETSRGLTNIYYILNNGIAILDKLKDSDGIDSDRFQQKYFEIVKEVIDNIIDSSTLLVQKESEIREKYIVWGSTENTTVIKFDELETFIEQDENEDLRLGIFFITYLTSELLEDAVFDNNKKRDSKRRIFEKIILKGVFEKTILKDIFYHYDSKYYEYITSENLKLEGNLSYFVIDNNLGFSQRFIENVMYRNWQRILDDRAEVSASNFDEKFLIVLYNSLSIIREEAKIYLYNLQISNPGIFNYIGEICSSNKANMDHIIREMSVGEIYYKLKLEPTVMIDDINSILQSTVMKGVINKSIYDIAKSITSDTILKTKDLEEARKKYIEKTRSNENSNVKLVSALIKNEIETKKEDLKNGKKRLDITASKYNKLKKNFKNMIEELISHTNKFNIEIGDKLKEKINNLRTADKGEPENTLALKLWLEVKRRFFEYKYNSYEYRESIQLYEFEDSSYNEFVLDEVFLKQMKSLAYNTRAWYGVLQARDILNEILYNSRVKGDLFSEDEKLFIEGMLLLVPYKMKSEFEISELKEAAEHIDELWKEAKGEYIEDYIEAEKRMGQENEEDYSEDF